MTARIDGPVDGGAAFPVTPPLGSDNRPSRGISMLDYFAGQALAGLCANPGGPFQANDRDGWGLVNCSADTVSRQAYELARAMLAARKAP